MDFDTQDGRKVLIEIVTAGGRLPWLKRLRQSFGGITRTRFNFPLETGGAKLVLKSRWEVRSRFLTGLSAPEFWKEIGATEFRTLVQILSLPLVP